jgi:hypothetical protein
MLITVGDFRQVCNSPSLRHDLRAFIGGASCTVRRANCDLQGVHMDPANLPPF